MTIKLYTQVALTVDLPQYGLKNGDVAYAIEHYPMPDGTEDGYSLEGFGIPIDGITVEVTESQIRSLTAQELDEIQHRSLSA
jgi:uncharacterized membrane-anchored protein